MAMMSMEEFFYGASEPAYFDHYGRQASLCRSRSSRRRMELTIIDLMVPMCCRKCENEVQDALLSLSSVQEVVCERYNQRVTVTGFLEPAQALQQVKRVKSGAALWPESSSQSSRYEVSLYQKPQYLQQGRRSSAPSDTQEKRITSYPDHYSRSSSGRYFRTACPRYKDAAITHVMDINPTTATRVEMAC